MTVYQVILRIRGVLEHAAVPDRADPLRNARTILTKNPVARFFLNPHHVAYHLEHHLYPAVPHYNLPRLHRALAASDAFRAALVERGYGPALRSVIGG
jgi:fatty acid desaturase